MGEHTSHHESYSSGTRSAFRAPVRRERGVPVIEVHGEVDLATVSELRRVICGAGAPCEEPALAVVDLREADFIDVYGVRMLVEEALASSGLGGELRLVVPAEGCVARVFELLEIGRMLDLRRELGVRVASGQDRPLVAHPLSSVPQLSIDSPYSGEYGILGVSHQGASNLPDVPLEARLSTRKTAYSFRLALDRCTAAS